MINKTLKLYALVLIPITIFFTSHASWAWEIDTKRSSVSFVSIKKTNIGESHHFTDISGKIDQGIATLTISPDSVDSRVPIRNERMRTFLFKSNIYPTIEVEANVEDALNKRLLEVTGVPALLHMNGISKEINLNVRIGAQTDSTLIVSSVKPVIINAADFEMENGIRQLSQLVNGLHIAESVPVSFSLVFIK